MSLLQFSVLWLKVKFAWFRPSVGRLPRWARSWAPALVAIDPMSHGAQHMFTYICHVETAPQDRGLTNEPLDVCTEVFVTFGASCLYLNVFVVCKVDNNKKWGVLLCREGYFLNFEN